MEEKSLVQTEPAGLVPVDPATAAAGEAAKARIQSAYLVAMNRPRDTDNARTRIMDACKRPSFAKTAEYAKPVGGKKIIGPSIRFAELAIREWGNILIDVRVIYEDEVVRRTSVMVVDLETNASFSKEIQTSKTVERQEHSLGGRKPISSRRNASGDVVYIVEATDAEMHNKDAALISKSIRTEGLRVIPSDIIEDALITARNTLRAHDSAAPDKAKKDVADAFSELGVKPKDLAEYLGHKLDTISPSELQDLRSIYTAIKEKDAAWNDYVKPKEKEINKKGLADMAEESTFKVKCPNNYEPKSMLDCEACNNFIGCPEHPQNESEV